MKIRNSAGLAVLFIAVILLTGCKDSKTTDKSSANDLSDVQAVLEQGVTETEDGTADKQDEFDDQTKVSGIEAETETPADTAETADGVDVDLTALSSTMVYSEVYNMMCRPEDYSNKTVKMSGIHAVYLDENTGKCYHACIISDATACCSQGIEFELSGDHEYPGEGENICVTGVFDTYKEGEYTYCTLRKAELTT